MEKTIRELNKTEIDTVSGGTFDPYSDLGYGTFWDWLNRPWIDYTSPDVVDPNP